MRTKKGIVTSAKMTGTVTVTVHSFAFHPIYKKRFRKSKKFLADPNGMDVAEGDLVIITECRPLSKNKYFKVTEMVEQAPRVSDVTEGDDVEKAMHREKVDEGILLKKESEEADDAKDAEEKKAPEKTEATPEEPSSESSASSDSSPSSES